MRRKRQKKVKGMFAKVKTGPKKIVMVNVTIFFCKKPLNIARIWRPSLENMNFAHFEAKLNKSESESGLFLCMAV